MLWALLLLFGSTVFPIVCALLTDFWWCWWFKDPLLRILFFFLEYSCNGNSSCLDLVPDVIPNTCVASTWWKMKWLKCYFCVFVYVHMCACVNIRACGDLKTSSAAVPQEATTLFFWVRISYWTWDSPSRLGCLLRGALEIHLSLLPQHWDYRCAAPCLAF